MKNEFPSLTTASGKAVVLRSVRAEGRLEGLLLSMTLRQTFRNDTRKNLEVTYTFPLAFGAVLLGLEATLGGKRMCGQVMARQEAREQYEEAVEKGDAPIMVEKAQGGVFSASLGSLKSGEEALIELHYAQLLSFEQGRVRLVVPTTIAHRYGDAVKQGRLQPDQATEPDLLAEHAFGLSLTLTGPMAQARLASPSHPIQQQRLLEAGQEVVIVGLQRQAWIDRDFVLLLDGLQGQSFAIAGPDTRSGKGHAAVIASYCPALPSRKPEDAPLPLRIKALVDCSGSMAGQSIEQARDALREMARGLCAADLVAYSRFGGRTHRILPARFCEPHNIEALIDAINETDADLGGTEMERALEDTFALLLPREVRHEGADVLLVTDGDIWGAQAVVDAAARSGHRVFALGVGSAPAESLLREMAEATGGACEFVTPGEDMAAAVRRLMARIRNSLAVKFNLRLEEDPIWVNPPPLRIAPEETVHTFARLLKAPAHAPTLLLEGMAPPPATLTRRTDDLVARLVAARQIGEMDDKSEASALAETYQLVTENTNLLLVFERAEADKTDGMPALHQVRQMMAAGAHGTGRMKFGVEHGVLYSIQANSPIAASALSGEMVLSSRILDQNNVPSVWRSNRTATAANFDALALGTMDNLEIPAFLRRQSENREHIGNGPEAVVHAFNAAIAKGQNLRQALRAVMALDLGYELIASIQDSAKRLGSMTVAWACYLIWLSDEPQARAHLSAEARQAIEERLQSVAAEAIRQTQERFRSEGLRPA